MSRHPRARAAAAVQRVMQKMGNGNPFDDYTSQIREILGDTYIATLIEQFEAVRDLLDEGEVWPKGYVFWMAADTAFPPEGVEKLANRLFEIVEPLDEEDEITVIAAHKPGGNNNPFTARVQLER